MYFFFKKTFIFKTTSLTLPPHLLPLSLAVFIYAMYFSQNIHTLVTVSPSFKKKSQKTNLFPSLLRSSLPLYASLLFSPSLVSVCVCLCVVVCLSLSCNQIYMTVLILCKHATFLSRDLPKS